MNRPYKSTSLDDLVIICANVPNRDVLRAILTELSHRSSKQEKKLEAILVQHLINQSGDNVVSSLATGASDSIPKSTDQTAAKSISDRIEEVGHRHRRRQMNPQQPKKTARKEFVPAERSKSTPVTSADKTDIPSQNALARDGHNHYLSHNKTAAAAASEAKNTRIAGNVDQSEVSSSDNRQAARWVIWKSAPGSTAIFTGGVVVIAAIFGSVFFYYSGRVQTAAKLEEKPIREQSVIEVQNDTPAIDKRHSAARDNRKEIETPENVIPAQDIPKNIDPVKKTTLAQDTRQGAETSNRGLALENRNDPVTPVKIDPALDFRTGLIAYENGDYPTALGVFRTLSEKENAQAQYYLGLIHDRGLGVPQDSQEAAKWYFKSAAQGNDAAQLVLGKQFYEGEVVPENHEEAALWYNKSAAQGNVEAQNRLGFMYEKGYGVDQNYDAAAKWYRNSAEQGNANAQKNLSARYFLGQGVVQDNIYAYMWAEISASQGNSIAIKIRDQVAKKMTASQRLEAKKLTAECVRKSFKHC